MHIFGYEISNSEDLYARGTLVVAMHCNNIVLTCAENRP